MDFSTAKGNSINLFTSKTIKRSKNLFADINNEAKKLLQAANETTKNMKSCID